MKIRADRAELADAVTWVSQAISKKPAVLALSGMRIKAEGERLTLMAFDYDVSHSALVDVEVQSEGECLISGSFLREVLGGMRGKEVELVLDGRQLTIESGRASYRAQCMSLDDYPNLPKFPAASGEIPAENLTALVAATKYAVDDASAFGQVRGLHLEGDDKRLLMTGFNRSGGGYAEQPWAARGEISCQVPARAFDTAVRGLHGTVGIGIDRGGVGLGDETRRVTLRTFDTEYLDWRRILRDEHDDTVTLEVDVDELAAAVKRVGALAGDMPIALDVIAEEVAVSAVTDGTDGCEALDAKADGEIRVGFGPRLLLDALSAVPGGRVRIGFNGPKKVATVRSIDHPWQTQVIMPRTVKD